MKPNNNYLRDEVRTYFTADQLNDQDSVNSGTEHSGGEAVGSPRPALATCPNCLSNFGDAYQAMCEATRLRVELATACRHGQALSEEVDRLRAMIKEANKMGFEILEQINIGSGAMDH